MSTLILLNQDISNLISDWHGGNQSKWEGSLSLNIIYIHKHNCLKLVINPDLWGVKLPNSNAKIA